MKVKGVEAEAATVSELNIREERDRQREEVVVK